MPGPNLWSFFSSIQQPLKNLCQWWDLRLEEGKYIQTLELIYTAVWRIEIICGSNYPTLNINLKNLMSEHNNLMLKPVALEEINAYNAHTKHTNH